MNSCRTRARPHKSSLIATRCQICADSGPNSASQRNDAKCHKQTSVAHQIFDVGREGWLERTASCQGKIGLDYGMLLSDQIIPNWRQGADYRADSDNATPVANEVIYSISLKSFSYRG